MATSMPPTAVPAPIPTVAPGNPTRPPTLVPTPAPTRTPTSSSTSVTLSGITCSDFDADIFQSGMDLTIGDGATFSDSVCADSRRLQEGDPALALQTSTISISTEVTIELAVVSANEAADPIDHILTQLGDGTDLEANIKSFARRRLDVDELTDPSSQPGEHVGPLRRGHFGGYVLAEPGADARTDDAAAHEQGGSASAAGISMIMIIMIAAELWSSSRSAVVSLCSWSAREG